MEIRVTPQRIEPYHLGLNLLAGMTSIRRGDSQYETSTVRGVYPKNPIRIIGDQPDPSYLDGIVPERLKRHGSEAPSLSEIRQIVK